MGSALKLDERDALVDIRVGALCDRVLDHVLLIMVVGPSVVVMSYLPSMRMVHNATTSQVNSSGILDSVKIVITKKQRFANGEVSRVVGHELKFSHF